MSSYNRRFLLCLPAALVACGFSPVYGPGGTGSKLHGKILFNGPETEDGYLLVRDLEERMGRASDPVYEVDMSVVLTQQGQAVTASGEITRFSFVGAVSYEMSRISDGKLITKNSVENFTGYSATGTTVETLAGESDARIRLMRIMADQIAVQLLALQDIEA